MNKERGELYVVENEEKIKKLYEQLRDFEQSNRLLQNAEDLVSLEEDLFTLTNQLTALLLQKQIQANLDAPEQVKQEKKQQKHGRKN